MLLQLPPQKPPGAQMELHWKLVEQLAQLTTICSIGFEGSLSASRKS